MNKENFMEDILKIPQYLDRVKHKTHKDFVGIVNANYILNGKAYLDVEITSDHIYYFTSAENWEVVERED